MWWILVNLGLIRLFIRIPPGGEGGYGSSTESVQVNFQGPQQDMRYIMDQNQGWAAPGPGPPQNYRARFLYNPTKYGSIRPRGGLCGKFFHIFESFCPPYVCLETVTDLRYIYSNKILTEFIR